MITVCQHCGHEHCDIDDSKNGRMIKCVSCEKYFKVTPKKDESQLSGELEAPDMPVRARLRIKTEAIAPMASAPRNFNPATAALMASAPVMSRVVKPVAMAVPVAAAPVAAAPVAVAPAARVAPVAAAPVAAAPVAAAPVAVAPAVRVAPVAAAPVVAAVVDQKNKINVS